MRRPLVLPSLLLPCLVSTTALCAGLDPSPGIALTAMAPGVGAESQWLNSPPARPIIPRAEPPRPARRYLMQVQAQGQAQAPASGPPGEAGQPTLADEALKAEMEKRWSDAERLYREALTQDPNNINLLLHLSDVLAVQNKRLEAAQAIGRAANLKADDADLQLHTSEAYGAADRPADAQRYNDRALSLRPNDEALLRRRADLAIWLGDNARAEESLRWLSEANPNDLKVRRDLAKVLGWQGRWEDAGKALSGYVDTHPNDRDAILDLARIQSAAGDSDAAQQSLRRFRDAGGDEQTYQAELKKVLSDINAPIRAEMEKRYGDAERMYREMLAQDPNRIDALLRLVDLLATEGKRLEAAQTMAKAADLKPDDADLQLRASEAYGAAAQLADAKRYLDRALALRSTDPTLQRRRAELDIWAGKSADAEKQLRAVIAADPSDVTAKRDLARLVASKKPAEAADLLTQYLAQHPDDKEALLDLARVNAARGKTAENAELLKRYKEAGGEETTFRRELQRARPPAKAPTRAAARRGPAPAARPTAGGPPPNIPPEVIRAEGAKRYDEAARILRGLIAREPNRVDLWLRLVDNLAAQKKTVEAAQAMGKAADLRPNDADLQLRASEAFGAADRPAEALRYVDLALAARPNDLALHRRRAEVAIWAGDNAQAEESLRILIAADPTDLKLQLDLGRVVGWQGRLEEAYDILANYVAQLPTEKEGLIALSRIQAGRGDSESAVALLERYRAAGGDELTYQRDLALDLAWAGRPRSALSIADPGLARDPNDFQFHFARAVAMQSGYETGLALQEVERMTQLRPTAPEIAGLRRSIEVPNRPYLQLDLGGRWESDNVSAQAVELSYHQPINEVWWVFAGGNGDFAQALRGSSFAPIQGGTSMSRGGGYIGAQARLDFGTIGSARVGGTSTSRGATEPTWQLLYDSKVSDELRVQLASSRDLQIISPRSLSRDITRIDTAANLTITPDLAWTVAATVQEGELSHNNHFWRGFVAPRRAVLRTQYLNVDLGISGNFYGYTRNPPLDGYYSPSFYRNLAANAYFYYKMSEESGISFIMSYGANKDELMKDYKFTQDYTAEATFGALSEWMLKIRGAYTNHGSNGPNFSAESVGLTLVKRF